MVEAELKLGIVHFVHFAPQADGTYFISTGKITIIAEYSLSQVPLVGFATREEPVQTPSLSVVTQVPASENWLAAHLTQSLDVGPAQVSQFAAQAPQAPALENELGGHVWFVTGSVPRIGSHI
jgi:hypothetical protein